MHDFEDVAAPNTEVCIPPDAILPRLAWSVWCIATNGFNHTVPDNFVDPIPEVEKEEIYALLFSSLPYLSPKQQELCRGYFSVLGLPPERVEKRSKMLVLQEPALQ